MFDEMIKRIQRTTVAMLLKIKVQPVPQPVQPVRPQGAIKPPQPVAPAKPTRSVPRMQLPTPLSGMSSYQKMQKVREEQENTNVNGKKED